MDYRSDLMSAKSKFGNGPECQLRGVGGSSGQAAGDANKGGRSLQPWPHQAVTSAITSGSSYSGSSYGLKCPYLVETVSIGNVCTIQTRLYYMNGITN